MNEVSVTSWNMLVEELYNKPRDEQLRRYRATHVFRGLSDARFELTTTLIRLGGNYVELERHLLRNFKKYAHRDAVERDSDWHWLTLAQHHGLPTRLLDWTYSPFVAMHFAVADLEHFDKDGVIWDVNYVEVKEYLPDKLRSALNREACHVFTISILEGAVKDLEAFDRLHFDDGADFAVFLEPPSLDERIINQFSLFSVMPNANRSFSDWLATHEHLYRKIVIPAKLKWEIRDKLDNANINERVLFPGLDGLSSWLKRHYSPGPTD
jgi:hypothetical protein